MNKNSRGRFDFNAGWTVRKPTGPFAAFNDGPPVVTEITLPHDSLRDTERTPDAPSASGSGYFASGAFTYEKRFDVPADWAGKWVGLQFDGVASNALVYLNGALIAERPYTYARFLADLTAYLLPGQSNHIRVEVRVHKDSRWYTGAGIYRQVELLVADAVHLVPDSLQTSTVEIIEGVATVDVAALVANSSQTVKSVRAELTIFDPTGRALAVRNVPISVLPNQPGLLRQRFQLEEPELWSADSPTLHRVSIRLFAGAEELDSVATAFGIRVIQVDAKRGLRINGEPLKLRGACIHVDNGLLGAISLPSAELRKVRKLKAAGFNAVRISHNPASQAFLDACDVAGMLVMNEAFDSWTQEKSEFDQTRNFVEWWERDIEALVLGSVNHPSVIMYSIGNEIPELGTIAGRIWNRKIADKVRSIDSTRPVTNGINTLLTIDIEQLLLEAGGLNSFMGDTGDISAGFGSIAVTPQVSGAIEEVCSALDVVGYNYAETRYGLDATEHPDRVIVGSETFTTAIAKNWKLVEQYPHVIGDFCWTGWDYLGEVGIGAVAYKEDESFNGALGREYPFLLSYCGDFDITGYRRPSSYYREIVFGLRSEPYIAVQHPARYAHTLVSTSPWAWSDVVEGWSWTGFEGQPIRVEVYADADEVELLLNGTAIAKSPVGVKKALVANFDVVYEPGEIVAVAYRAGTEISRSKLVSAIGAAALRVTSDKPTLEADGQDLAHLELAFVGENGSLLNLLEQNVSVEIEGPATLAGLGNSNPQRLAPMDSSEHSTFDGRALAIIRATGSGSIRVTISSPNFETQTVQLEAKAV